MQNLAYETQLKELWKQGQRGIVAAFLRRVMHSQASLADVAAALRFAEVQAHLHDLRLADVWPTATAATVASPAAPAPAVPAPKARRAASKPRRRRRGPDEMQAIKDQLAAMLHKEPGSLDTTQLHEGLAQQGHDVDRITLKRLLVSLAEAGTIQCLGGRPKAWRQVAPRPESQRVGS